MEKRPKEVECPFCNRNVTLYDEYTKQYECVFCDLKFDVEFTDLDKNKGY